MLHFAKRTMVLLAALLLGSWNEAFAQLGNTNLSGLQIAITDIYRLGDSRDLNCSLGFKFTNSKADRAISMSKVKILEAVDDTGRNLVRTNQALPYEDFWSPIGKNASSFYATVGGLKAPDPSAQAIKHLKAEVDLLDRAEIPLVLTNFMSQPHKLLHHSLLDQYHVRIVFNGMADQAPPGSLVIDKKADKRISLNVDDPHHKIINLAFTEPSGQLLSADREETFLSSNTTNERIYCFQKTPQRGLNLKLSLAASETTNTIRFNLDNIRLPWIDLPDFNASATSATLRSGKGTNPCTGSLILNFAGGPLTNALGIRNLLITKMEDDSGQPVKVRWIMQRFSALPDVVTSDGRHVSKYVMLAFNSPAPKAIHILKGEAELVRQDSQESGKVVISNFQSQTTFDLPILKTNNVTLIFIGAVNYADKRREFSTNTVSESGGILPAEAPAATRNSLEFVLRDPNGMVVTPFGCDELNFCDAHGKELQPIRVMFSQNHIVYRFQKLPPPDTQLALCLAMSQSLQQVPFEIRDIPLN